MLHEVHYEAGVPTIRDRVVQTAAVLMLSPIFEADFTDAMYGYRPRRSAQQAVAAVHEALKAGYTEFGVGSQPPPSRGRGHMADVLKLLTPVCRVKAEMSGPSASETGPC